mmetsp:Transcript_9904/g.23650  ORF Transcript_9904/g.23650 Transcript_9904/m.23650 type:complete len:201 (-) Transcript_9904:1742-2344(-)
MHLSLENIDVGNRVLQNVELPLQVIELDLENTYLVQPVTVLYLSFVESALLDFDFLVEEGKLVVTPDKLRAKNVSLVDHNVVLLLLPESLLVSLVYYVIEFLDLGFLACYRRIRLVNLLLRLVQLQPQTLLLLLYLHVVEMLLDQRKVLCTDLLLQLLDLMVDYLELAFHLLNLVLGLDEVLGVQIPVRPHRLVKVLLLL